MTINTFHLCDIHLVTSRTTAVSLFNLPIAMMDGLSNYNAHKYTQ